MIKITIITVCRNAEKVIRRTIESVLNQTYPHREYIVIDGASTDSTLDILQEYSWHGSIQVFSEQDYGIYNAMNRGIVRAAGDYIIFLNAGDVFYKDDVVANTALYLEQDRSAVYCGSVLVKSPCNERISALPRNEETLKQVLLSGHMPCHQGIFAPIDVLRNHYFREKYRIRADYEWLVYCVCNGVKCVMLPFVICEYDGSGVSSDADCVSVINGETQDILEQYLPQLLGGQGQRKYYEDRTQELMNTAGKYKHLFQFMGQWMSVVQRGLHIEDYFVSRHYCHIAVYGMGIIGQCFVESLRDTPIIVEYLIDRNANEISTDRHVITPDSEWEPVDVVVVTAITYIQEIRRNLQGKIECPVISIKEILDGMMQ